MLLLSLLSRQALGDRSHHRNRQLRSPSSQPIYLLRLLHLVAGAVSVQTQVTGP